MLVSTEELGRHPEWRVFDCRHDLAKPDWGFEEFQKAHIPGALFAHLERNLSAPRTGSNGRHPLPEPEDFIAWLGRQGLKAIDQVVCYDGGPGAMAARLWWMLRWVGHEPVAVLDGGLAKWTQERRAMTSEVPAFAAARYQGEADPRRTMKLPEIERNLKKKLLLDARAPARYRGEQEPIDPVAGHIPGALNRFNNDNLSPEGTFKKPELLRSEFESILSNRKSTAVIHYCGSGVAACHNALAMEIAGLTGSSVYIGSWSEWSSDPKRPIAR